MKSARSCGDQSGLVKDSSGGASQAGLTGRQQILYSDGSGGGLTLAKAVGELNPLDYLGQPGPSVELAPFALRNDHQLERHGEAGLEAQPVSLLTNGCPDKLRRRGRRMALMM